MSHAVFFSETVEVAARLDVDEPKLKRRMRPPRRLDRALRLEDGAEPAHFATSEERFKCVFLEDIDRLDQASRYSENISCDDHVLTTGDRVLITGGRDAVNKTATFYWLDAGAFPRGIPRAKKVKTRKQQKVSRNVVQSASFCSFSK